MKLLNSSLHFGFHHILHFHRIIILHDDNLTKILPILQFCLFLLLCPYNWFSQTFHVELKCSVFNIFVCFWENVIKSFPGVFSDKQAFACFLRSYQKVTSLLVENFERSNAGKCLLNHISLLFVNLIPIQDFTTLDKGHHSYFVKLVVKNSSFFEVNWLQGLQDVHHEIAVTLMFPFEISMLMRHLHVLYREEIMKAEKKIVKQELSVNQSLNFYRKLHEKFTVTICAYCNIKIVVPFVLKEFFYFNFHFFIDLLLPVELEE